MTLKSEELLSDVGEKNEFLLFFFFFSAQNAVVSSTLKTR